MATGIVDLLNSRPYANLPDKLDDPGTAQVVLRPFGQEGPPPAARIEQVRAVRDALVALAGEGGDWADLTARLSAATFGYDFDDGVRLRQVTGDPVLGRIAQEVAALVTAGNWTRLRLCANDECREAFYDNTRSRTRRWHSYEYCGNKVNVAAHRARGK
ncbi:CGNR zinc finger domain-containing protein [Paractinoplanes globisporus]|jgi:predicted RNA-binding Zn ribbon-like protein|uniref:CGNR zinc finger domain-containing protein n=1 Tax=Paractinoplanes globisporus TaxID=113565 RepID=A0ABW6W4E0_9ACTN|nr:CGNR zinc finger domain-containing protein [Actinoplanes globisporus]